MAVSRLRLYDLMTDRFAAEAIGYCGGDVAAMADVVNRAQERLLTCREAGDTGWWGGYAEMAFEVTQTNPFITLPRGAARAIRFDSCDRPLRIQNQFYEYLQFGSGHWPKVACGSTANVCRTGPREAFRRNTAATFTDLTTPGYGLRFYPGDAADAGLRVLVGCTDANSQTVYTLDGPVQVNGVFTTLGLPFVDLKLPGTTTALELGSITAIQKDITIGTLSIYEVNLTTGDQTLLSIMEPGETVAYYTRYYLNALPQNCCNSPVTGNVQVSAIVKLDLVPARVATDCLLIQSKEAIINEAQSARLGDSDSSDAKAQSAERHRAAVRFLQGQLSHYEGREQPAIAFSPFGNQRLSQQRIGLMT